LVVKALVVQTCKKEKLHGTFQKRNLKKVGGNFRKKTITTRGQVVNGNEPFEKYQALGS